MSISEVCYHVGFTGILYFNRTFRKYMGCSPSQYLSVESGKSEEV